MAINSIVSTGLQGIQSGLDRGARAASDIASLGAPNFGTTSLGTTSPTGAGDKAGINDRSGGLTQSLIDLKLSEIQVKASAAVLRTADEVVGTLIDIRA